MTPESQQQLRHFQFVDCAVRSAGHFYLMAAHIYQLDDDCDDPDGEPAVAADPEPGLREAIPGGLLRKPQAQWLPALRWRRMEGEDTGWQDCQALPAHCAPLFEQGWNALRDGAAALAHARTLIAPERLAALLALPIAAPYDDFYDDDRNGLWLGAVYCAFRQDGALRKGQPQPALLRVARSRRDEGNERYDFSLHRHLDGSASVLIEYCPQEGKDWIDVSHAAPGRLPDALRMFEAASRALQQANADLLAGSPPNRDDAFALQHWRARGYLH